LWQKSFLCCLLFTKVWDLLGYWLYTSLEEKSAAWDIECIQLFEIMSASQGATLSDCKNCLCYWRAASPAPDVDCLHWFSVGSPTLHILISWYITEYVNMSLYTYGTRSKHAFLYHNAHRRLIIFIDISLGPKWLRCFM